MRVAAREHVRAGVPLEEAVMHFRKMVEHEALESVRGNRSRAAELLKVHRNTLCRDLQRDKRGRRSQVW